MGKELFFIGRAIGEEGVVFWWRYAAGASGYLFLEQLLKKPMWIYVVGHELTHAVSGIMSGARVHSFKATSKGGEVKLSKSNAFIALSPYIIPFYSILVILTYALAVHFWPRNEVVWGFEVLLGATLAFHLSLTWSALHKHQSDLKVLGFLLSGVLIALGNGLILGLLGVSLFKKTPTLKQYAQGLAQESVIQWKNGFTLAKNELIKQIENRKKRIG